MNHTDKDYEENIKTALAGLKRRETDIVELATKALQALEKPESVKIHFFQDIQDHAVWIDEERIAKALANLLTNAVEAMPDGGDIKIDLKGDETHVIITINDTGSGISRKDMDNIFIPFFTTKPAGEGTGLGLAFAYGAVKLHSGQFCLESNAEPSRGPRGTRITITLPRARPELSNIILDE